MRIGSDRPDGSSTLYGVAAGLGSKWGFEPCWAWSTQRSSSSPAISPSRLGSAVGTLDGAIAGPQDAVPESGTARQDLSSLIV